MILDLAAQSDFKMTTIVKHYSNLTMQQALTAKTQCIGSLSKKDDLNVRKCISNLFIGISLYFDKPLEPSQTNIIAEELLATYNYRSLRLEDLVVICQRLKQSEMYKLTLQIILREINKYTIEREKMAMFNSQRNSKQEKQKKDFNNTTLEDRLKKAFYLTPSSK
jgi:hypothetical protein